MDHSAHIEALDDLIRINNDRIASYRYMLDKAVAAGGPEAGRLFQQYIDDCTQYVNELSNCVQGLGSPPVTGTTLGGKIYRMWMDIRDEFAAGTDAAVSALESAIFVDSAAVRAYEIALHVLDKAPPLPAHVRTTLIGQLEAIRGVRAANEALDGAAGFLALQVN